jgi:hypothetical protein
MGNLPVYSTAFSPKKPIAVALHLTVVTSTTAQSDISEYARDAHAASVVPNE